MSNPAALLLAGLLLCLPVSAPGENGGAPGLSLPSETRVFINGRELLSEYDILRREGVDYIPVSQELEYMLGATADIDEAGPRARLEFVTLESVLVFAAGEREYIDDGLARALDREPFLRFGLFYVPVEDFFHALECEVEFDGRDYHITKVTLFPDVISDIPGDFLDVEKDTEVGALDALAAEAAAAPETTAGKTFDLGFTYENKTAFENVTVSGIESQSNMERQTDFHNEFKLRTLGRMRNGYTVNGVFRTNMTTDRTVNQGEVDRFNLSFAKGGKELQLYDMTQKVSRFVMKNYLLQGVSYRRRGNAFDWKGIWGKTPKDLGETPYNRYTKGLILEKLFGDGRYTASYVNVKDTGVTQNMARLDNTVYSVDAEMKFDEVTIVNEYAYSVTDIFHDERIKAFARYFEAKYRDRQSYIIMSHEQVGSEFVSETTFFTPGRREFQVMTTNRINRRLTLGGGYKTTRFMGQSTFVIPLQARVVPFASRPRLKLKLQDTFEKSTTAFGPRITDKRKFEISDRIGRAKADIRFERRRQKDSFAEWKFRTTQRYKYVTSVTKQLYVYLQHKRELKTRSSNPKKRFYQYKLIYEPEDWAELSLSVERYYNNTTNDRMTTSLTYKKLDIFNDREYSLEYRFLNYSGHNDSHLLISYSFLK